MSVLLSPGVERRVPHPELPAEVADGSAGVGLAEGIDDLFLARQYIDRSMVPILFCGTSEAAGLLRF